MSRRVRSMLRNVYEIKDFIDSQKLKYLLKKYTILFLLLHAL